MALLFEVKPTKIGDVGNGIGVIELDATLSESHTSRVDATKHPVERGAKITDHLRNEPDSITITGFVSNTPISRAAQTRAVNVVGTDVQTTAQQSSAFATPGYAEEAFAKLRDIQTKGVLVTVTTELRTYESMALVSLEVPRDKSVGDALVFTATFEQVQVVANKVTLLRPTADPRATAKRKAGRKTLKYFYQDASVEKVKRKVLEDWKAAKARMRGQVRKFKFTTGAT